MPSNDTTVKFKADISDLKASMQEAGRLARLANSEFKEASAGLGKWSVSADGLSAKLTQLTKQEQIQQRVLDALQLEYKQVAQAEGESSKGAQELLIRINNQKAALKQTQSDISHYSQKLKELGEASDDIGELSALDKQKQQVNQLENELDSLKSAYASLQLEERDTTEESERLAREINELSGELKEAKNDLRSAEKSADDLDQSLEEVEDSSSKAGDGFTVMKGALANLVADGIRFTIDGLKDLAKETYNAGANFESSMSQVEAISGASASEMEALTAKAKEMGETTKFSASESADAFNYMAMAGWKTEDMIGGIEGIMNLAAASGEDLATTSDIVTDALTAMGYSAGDAGQLADVMAAASSNANTNVGLMGLTFQYAAPIIGALGMNMEDAAVAIGLMANAGIKGEKSGTALRSILTRLSAPPKECADAMEELGISLTDSEGNMKDLDTVMKDLRKAFDGLSETEQTSYAKHIAGQEAMSGLLAIVNAAPEDFDKLTKAVENSNGAAQEMADTMNDNVAGQITLLKSKIEGIMIQVFEKLAPTLRKAIDEISKALDGVDWNKVSNAIGKFAEKAVEIFKYILQNGGTIVRILIGVGTAIGVAFAVNKVSDFISSLKNIGGVIATAIAKMLGLTTATTAATTAQEALNVAQSATPWGAIALGIAGAVAGLIALVNWLDKTNSYTDENTKATDELVDKYDSLNESLESNKEARETAIDDTLAEAKTAEILADKMDTLAKKENKSASEKELLKYYVEQLNELMPDLNLEYDEEADKLNKSTKAIKDNIEASKELALAKAAQSNLQTIAEDMAKTEIEYANAVEQNEKNQRAYNQALQEVNEARKKFDESGQKDAFAYDEWVKADTKMRELKQTYEDSQTTVDGYKQKLSELNQEFDKTSQFADEKLNSAEIIKGLNALTEKAKEKGVEIPQAVSDGIKSGQYVLPESVGQLKNLIAFDDLAQKAQAAGITIPDSISSGISSGELKPKDAIEQMKSLVSFADLLTEAGLAGQNVPEYISNGITSGNIKPANAVKEMENYISYKDALTKAKEAGVDIPDEIKKGVESGKTKPSDAIKQINNLMDKAAQSVQPAMNKDGTGAATEYTSGVGSKTGEAKTQGKSLADNTKSGVESVDITTSGENFGQGFLNGIGSKIKAAWTKGWELAIEAQRGVKAGQQEGSPSKLTYKSGVFFTQGYINGIASQQKKLVKTVKNMVSSVIEIMGNMSNYNFSETGTAASEAFANAIDNQVDYMLARIQYKNEEKLKEFDTQISKLQNKSTKKQNKLQAASDKKVKQLEAKRDKEVAALEKKKNALSSKKSDQAAKKKLTAQITQIKNSYNKQINAEKAAVKKQITATKNNYTKLVNEQNKIKSSYQSASAEMLSEFQKAVNQYQSKAQALIDDTINGITDKYNERYNELINKQDNLISKLKEAGDLFEVSNAGVMTVNDLKEQTKAIKDYTDKLQKIKEKVSSDLFDQIASYDMKEGSAFMDRLLAMSADDLDAYNKAYTEKMEAAQKAGESIYKSDFDKVASDYETEIDKAFNDLPKQLEDLGNQAMKGFVNGLTQNTDYMSKQIKTFISGMVDQFKKQLKIKSPSRVMMEIGEYTGEGFNNGLISLFGDIQKTVSNITDMVSSPLDNFNSDLSGIRSTVGQGNGGVYGSQNSSSVVNNYNLVQNNTSPKALTALETYQARRQQVALVKAFT